MQTQKPPELDTPFVHRIGTRYVPRFDSVAFGRTPEVGTLILLNGDRVRFHFDSTSGRKGYFQRVGQWYWFNLYELSNPNRYDWDLSNPTGDPRRE